MNMPHIDTSVMQFGRRDTIDSDVVELIESVEFGTNGILLKIKNVAHELEQLARTNFPFLKDEQGLRAAVCHKRQTLGIGGIDVDSIYQFMLSVRPDSQGLGLGKLLMAKAAEDAKSQLKNGGLVYAMVETDNERSQRLFKSLGYKELGVIRMYTFSRAFPKTSPNARPATETERSGLIADLRKRTSGHAFAELADNVGNGDYYLLHDDDGKLRAGLQAATFDIDVVTMPGFGGWLTLNVIPRLPVIGRMVNPRHFQYVRFGNPWYRPGDHEALEILMSHVLALTKRYIGLITWDSRDPDHDSIIKKGRFGMLRGVNDTSFYIMGMPVGMDPGVEEKLSRLPFFMSPLDN